VQDDGAGFDTRFLRGLGLLALQGLAKAGATKRIVRFAVQAGL
jgi:hypothetical protein